MTPPHAPFVALHVAVIAVWLMALFWRRARRLALPAMALSLPLSLTVLKVGPWWPDMAEWMLSGAFLAGGALLLPRLREPALFFAASCTLLLGGMSLANGAPLAHDPAIKLALLGLAFLVMAVASLLNRAAPRWLVALPLLAAFALSLVRLLSLPGIA